MLDVKIDKILPITAVRDSLNKIIDEVEAGDELYVVTKNGKPAAILVGVHHLEKLTGISHNMLLPEETGIKSSDKEDSIAAPALEEKAAEESPATPTDEPDVPVQSSPPIKIATTEVPPSTPAIPEPTASTETSAPAVNPNLEVNDSNIDDLFSSDDLMSPTQEVTTTPPQQSAATGSQTPISQNPIEEVTSVTNTEGPTVLPTSSLGTAAPANDVVAQAPMAQTTPTEAAQPLGQDIPPQPPTQQV